MTEDRKEELGPEELERQEAERLPEREELALLTSGASAAVCDEDELVRRFSPTE